MNYLKVLLQKALNRQNIPGLIMALHDREPAVRSSAAVALGKTGRIGLEALIEALADTEAGVRASVASSLAQIGDAQAIEPLIVAFRAEERSSQARRAMLLALGRLRRPNSLAVLSEVITSKNDPLWEDAAELLVETREKAAVPALLSILEDSNYSHWHYQVAAARVLGDIRDMAAAGPLAKA
ncbi:MAG: HEAT repeat domain-containing protein, partial [Anaerolineae bacterium]|nr:HEAT repeat domain-containing protein [Anaerolineae bacterium]